MYQCTNRTIIQFTNELIEQCANLPMYLFENEMIEGFENEIM